MAELVNGTYAQGNYSVRWDAESVPSGIYLSGSAFPGLISASGPAVNLLLCIPFFILLIAGSAIVGSGITGILLIMIGSMGLSINAMIAFFNLLPVSILDGKKVFAWNPAIFVVMIAASLLLILFSLDYYGMMTAVMNAIL